MQTDCQHVGIDLSLSMRSSEMCLFAMGNSIQLDANWLDSVVFTYKSKTTELLCHVVVKSPS